MERKEKVYWRKRFWQKTESRPPALQVQYGSCRSMKKVLGVVDQCDHCLFHEAVECVDGCVEPERCDFAVSIASASPR